jgi:hypothetical protein
LTYCTPLSTLDDLQDLRPLDFFILHLLISCLIFLKKSPLACWVVIFLFYIHIENVPIRGFSQSRLHKPAALATTLRVGRGRDIRVGTWWTR